MSSDDVKYVCNSCSYNCTLYMDSDEEPNSCPMEEGDSSWSLFVHGMDSGYPDDDDVY